MYRSADPRVRAVHNFVHNHFGLTLLGFSALGFSLVVLASIWGHTLVSVQLITACCFLVFPDTPQAKKIVIIVMLGVLCIVLTTIALTAWVFDRGFGASVLAAAIGTAPLFIAGCVCALKERKRARKAYDIVEVTLEGGGVNVVTRVGNTVRRPAQPWTPTVHALLNGLHAHGFQGAPRAYGFDEQGREVLDFMPGEVGNYPLSVQVCSETALVSAAQLLRAFHDASAHCLHVGPAVWQFPPLEPVQVICHSDYAPYNCVFRNGEAVAIIDFDCARPGPRSWDLAYALYRFAPFMNPHNPDSFGSITEQSVRARKFLDAYGADRSLRQETVNLLTVRLRALTDFMRAAAQHDENFAHHIAQGHLAAYLNDIAYMENHERILQDVIVGPID